MQRKTQEIKRTVDTAPYLNSFVVLFVCPKKDKRSVYYFGVAEEGIK
jgi:hypothetical protein